MLLTGKQLAMKLGVHITTIRRACRNEHIPYERLGKLYFFDLDRVREAMRKNGGDVLRGGGGLCDRREKPAARAADQPPTW